MMIDRNGYPTEDTLDHIKKFDFQKDDPFEFADYICENWVNGYPPRWDKKHGTLQLSTGGWSGCESVITALQGDGTYIPWFWSMYWYKSRVGGHFWFWKIRRVRK